MEPNDYGQYSENRIGAEVPSVITGSPKTVTDRYISLL